MMRTYCAVVVAFAFAIWPCGCERSGRSAAPSELFDITPFFGQSREEVTKGLGEPSGDFGYQLFWEHDRTSPPLRRLVLEFPQDEGRGICWYVSGTVETGEDLESVPNLLGLGGLERDCTRETFRADVTGAVQSVMLKDTIGPYEVRIVAADAPGVSKRYKNFHVKLP